MKLSQYIYGRKPKAGLQVITRSRELPFFVQSWFESPRYGAAPVRTTRDRIWTCRYELQCFEGGAAISCLYPLKQTEVPCAEQQEPYIRGITPAVQHLLAGAQDAEVLTDNIASTLYFDGFHQIDDIYRLPNTFSEPVEWTPAPVALAPLTDRERELCVDMAACLWQAFMSRRENKTGELAQRAVKLIVPATTPAEELDHQRRIAANALALLPRYIRRWASMTFNMDVESESYPGGSAFYGMARATADSQPNGKGIVFDLEKQAWAPASAEERTYFMARERHQAVTLLDDTIAALPCKFDLTFHLQLHALLNTLCRGYSSIDEVNAFLTAHKLTSYKDALCTALAKAVAAECSAQMNRLPLSSLWVLAQVSPAAAQVLTQITCTVDECLAVVIRADVLNAHKGLQPADEAFCQLALRLSAADRAPLAEATIGNLRVWLSTVSQYTPYVETLVNGLINDGKLVFETGIAVIPWLQNPFVSLMKTIAGSERIAALLDNVSADTIFSTLQFALSMTKTCEWTTAVERLCVDWYNRHNCLPAATDALCSAVSARALKLADKHPLYPVFAVQLADSMGNGSKALLDLLRDPWVRALPQVLPYAQKFAEFVLACNVNELCGKIQEPADVLRMPQLWEEVSKGMPFAMHQAQWESLQQPLLNALANQNLQQLLTVFARMSQQTLPAECSTQITLAIARQTVNVLPAETLTKRSYEELETVIQLVAYAQPQPNSDAAQRFDVLCMLQALSNNKLNRDVYMNIRRALARISQENRQVLDSLLEYFLGQIASSVLLRSIGNGDLIDWARAFKLSMSLDDYAELSTYTLEDIVKRPVEEYELFLSLLCGFFRTDASTPFGFLLTPFDRQQLCEWLKTNAPKLMKRLQAEQKKYGDLPPALVEGLSLENKKR